MKITSSTKSLKKAPELGKVLLPQPSHLSIVSPSKTSAYPKVYLSLDLQRKIHEFKQVQELLESPIRAIKKPRKSSLVPRLLKTPKLYILTSSTPNYLNKIPDHTGCTSCNYRSVSFEASFDELLKEKRIKTNNAIMEFSHFCKRPKTVQKSYKGSSKFSSDQPVHKITIRRRSHFTRTKANF